MNRYERKRNHRGPADPSPCPAKAARTRPQRGFGRRDVSIGYREGAVRCFRASTEHAASHSGNCKMNAACCRQKLSRPLVVLPAPHGPRASAESFHRARDVRRAAGGGWRALPRCDSTPRGRRSASRRMRARSPSIRTCRANPHWRVCERPAKRQWGWPWERALAPSKPCASATKKGPGLRDQDLHLRARRGPPHTHQGRPQHARRVSSSRLDQLLGSSRLLTSRTRFARSVSGFSVRT